MQQEESLNQTEEKLQHHDRDVRTPTPPEES